MKVQNIKVIEFYKNCLFEIPIDLYRVKNKCRIFKNSTLSY